MRLRAVPIQFALFYVDYFTEYRVRSALTFSGNIRGAYEEALKERTTSSQLPQIHLGEIGYGSYGQCCIGRFYLITI